MTKRGKFVINPIEIVESVLRNVAEKKGELLRTMAPDLLIAPDGMIESKKIPATLLEKLDSNQVIQSQTMLNDIQLFQSLQKGRWSELIHESPMLPLLPRRLQNVRVSSPVSHSVKEGLMQSYPIPASGTAVTDINNLDNLARLSEASCQQLLAQVEKDVSDAQNDVSQIMMLFNQAVNLWTIGNASINPTLQLTNSTQGLSLLGQIGTLANSATASGQNALSIYNNLQKVTLFPCSKTILSEVQQAVQAIQAVAQQANNIWNSWGFVILYNALQQMQQQAQSVIAAIPAPAIPSPACYHVSFPTISIGFGINIPTGEIDVKLDETCTQSMISFLSGPGANTAKLIDDIVAAIISIAASGPAAIIVGAALAALAIDASLIATDMQVADGNHQGVTLHFSPFGYLALGGLAGEQFTLVEEQSSPDFGNYFISAMWITGN
jgi:hypothetical protein